MDIIDIFDVSGYVVVVVVCAIVVTHWLYKRLNREKKTIYDSDVDKPRDYRGKPLK